IAGVRPDGTGKIRSFTGYIPERPTFHEFMTVKEVLDFHSQFYESWNWPKALQMAAHMSLDLTTSIKGASKGTLAKTAWICATAFEPRVLMLDEPTSGLDPVIREAVLSEFVKELSQQRKTILVTNHHMEELLGIIDEFWLLSEGRIKQCISVEQLRHS